MTDNNAFKALYVTQCAKIEELNKLSDNFTKDGQSRYTVAYLSKRLTSLEEIWDQI